MTTSNRISTDQRPQAMTLYDNFIPAVQDGAYRLAVQQSVTYGDQAHHYYRDQRFVVVGPRYKLPQDEVFARYPPVNGMGNYATTLPHVVLRKRALPWERTVDGTKKEPWLALLVVSQQELLDAAHKLKPNDQSASPLQTTTTPKALHATPPRNTLLPKLDDEGDSDDDKTQVRVLDLPIDLFRNVCPRRDDLPYLAHVRCVDPSDKAPLKMHATGDFAVLIANRMPQNGSNVVFLVSLEGWRDLLEDTYSPPQHVDRVRLIMLDSWAFTDDERGIHTFGELAQSLTAGSLRVETTSADSYVNTALGRGYVPLEYQPYHGDPTFGWYRGPFTAQPVAKLSDTIPMYHRADAALVFDPASGLFDLSYAAAWQLGRLHALSAPSVAQEMRRFIDAQHDAFFALIELEAFLKKHANADVEEAFWNAELEALSAEFASLTDPEARAHLLHEMEQWGLSATQIERIKQGKHANGAGQLKRNAKSPIAMADSLLHFFAELALLYPIPFEYMVAHHKLLPPESIRFFYVDDNWIDAAIEGALSLVQDCSRDRLAVTTVRSELDTAISELVYQFRHHLQGMPRATLFNEKSADYLSTPKTGFLLRSALVSGWPGLEIICTDAGGNRLDVVRLDHLSKDLLLCIVSGEVHSAEIREPSEGLRFGLDDDDKVMLRYWQSGSGELGSPVIRDGNEVKKDGLILRSRHGVLDIRGLATKLDPAKTFGAAAFALQMLRSPEKQQIDINQHNAGDMIEDN